MENRNNPSSRNKRTSDRELNNSEILELNSEYPIVYGKRLLSDNQMLVSLAQVTFFKEKQSIRKLQLNVAISDITAKFNLKAVLYGLRLRRIETTDYKEWFNSTTKMIHNLPIYYYYELSTLPDVMFNGWRFKRKCDKHTRASAIEYVDIAQFKLKLESLC